MPTEQFRRINDALDAYDRRQQRCSVPVDRQPYLEKCDTEFERDLMLREMDCIDELARRPMKFVGDYLIDQLIAEGGFGIVMSGFDRQGNPVAIKVPHTAWHLARDREELDHEAIILHELCHENIVTLVDFGYDETWYLVMEYVNGYNLADALHEIRAPLTQWIDIIIQVCEALVFGHRHGVIHRDITLRNIMVTGEGTPVAKVLDYGIAKRHDDEASTMVRGTRRFMAPEQLEGRFDERTDIYSLGVVLREVVRAQYSDQRRIPSELTGVIERATAAEPGDRYQSARAFQAAICEVSDQLRTGAIPIARELVPKFSWASLAVTVLIFALAGALLVGTFSTPRGVVSRNKPWKPPARPVSSATAMQASPLSPAKNLSFDSPNALTWHENFSEQGHAKISINTVPTGAEITLYPLADGGPRERDGIELDTTKSCHVVPPGDYLVVAKWETGKFVETFRRIPKMNTGGVQSLYPVNAVVQGEKSLLLSPVSHVPENTARMIDAGDFWIDREATGKRSSPVPFSFGDVCQNLEAGGKRLPFANELRAAIANDLITLAHQEWTGTVVAESNLEKPGASGRLVKHPYNIYETVRHDDPDGRNGIAGYSNQDVAYRGVRSKRPFGSGR